MHEFEFDKIFIDGGFMTLQSTAVYCCGHRLCIVLYCIYSIAVFGYLTLWFFDNISTGSDSYICCSQVFFWNLLRRFHTSKGGVDILLVD